MKLSVPQLIVLRRLAETPGGVSPANEMERATSGTVSRATFNSLVRRGYIVWHAASADHSKPFRWELTQAGAQAFEREMDAAEAAL